MTIWSASDTHCNIKWFYLRSLGDCYILSVFFVSALMMDAKTTETCRLNINIR